MCKGIAVIVYRKNGRLKGLCTGIKSHDELCREDEDLKLGKIEPYRFELYYPANLIFDRAWSKLPLAEGLFGEQPPIEVWKVAWETAKPFFMKHTIKQLEHANLEGADLYGANLEGADLYGANLRSANLRGANLEGADLYGANLRGADLYGANLRGANLRSANLYGANLYGANLRGANLRSANLYGANLRSANLRSANLYGANLEGAVGVDMNTVNVERMR